MGLPLLAPANCGVVFVDEPPVGLAGPAFEAGGEGCQGIRARLLALARIARLFLLPAVASTAAVKGGAPLLPLLQKPLPELVPLDRHSLNAWEDPAARAAIVGMARRRLLIAGMLTESGVSFLALSAASEGYEVFVVGDACSSLTPQVHELALRRLQAAGVLMTSTPQVLLELQRDWTRHGTADAARAILEDLAATGSDWRNGSAASRDGGADDADRRRGAQ